VEHEITALHDRLLQTLGASYDFERELAAAGSRRPRYSCSPRSFSRPAA